MVVEGNIKRFLEALNGNRNPHNAPFRFVEYPDEPIFEDEDLLDVEIDVSQVLGRISNRILERHESEPEPENEPMPEPEYDEPMPENYRDLMQKLEQGINVLVYGLTHEFTFNNDDDLRTLLTHLLNNTYPPECSDELRVLIDDGREIIDDAIERIDYHHLDINEVVDYAMYIVNEQRRHKWFL